jgi:hypothetical protein
MSISVWLGVFSHGARIGAKSTGGVSRARCDSTRCEQLDPSYKNQPNKTSARFKAGPRNETSHHACHHAPRARYTPPRAAWCRVPQFKMTWPKRVGPAPARTDDRNYQFLRSRNQLSSGGTAGPGRGDRARDRGGLIKDPGLSSLVLASCMAMHAACSIQTAGVESLVLAFAYQDVSVIIVRFGQQPIAVSSTQLRALSA